MIFDFEYVRNCLGNETDEIASYIEKISKGGITCNLNELNAQDNYDLTAKRILDDLTFLLYYKRDLPLEILKKAVENSYFNRRFICPEIEKTVVYTTKGVPIKAKSLGMLKYVNSIENNTVTLAIGPAGTGKTYLAVAEAVKYFKAKTVERIILTRPAVEAGEKLGFLPGDLKEKVDPYLRPIYDALSEFLGQETYVKYMEKGVIEVAPLAFMRGRSLNDCFVILDEAQNTSPEQMKMFLTRIGRNSKAVVNGDISQTDLPFVDRNGLGQAMDLLKGVDEVGRVFLDERDAVRSDICAKILSAYDAKR